MVGKRTEGMVAVASGAVVAEGRVTGMDWLHKPQAASPRNIPKTIKP